MAGNLLMSVSQDERERAVFRSRKMYQTDLQSNLNTAYDNGINDGKMARNLEIVRNALLMNLSVDDIATLTGLSVEEIPNILNTPL